MKSLTCVIVGVSLITPSMTMAQRHTTPGTAERHAANLAESRSNKVAEAETKAKAENHGQMAERTQTHPAAVSKKANTNRAADSAANSPN